MESGRGMQRAAELGAGGTLEELARAGLRDRDYENLPTSARLRGHAALEAGAGRLLVCDCVDMEPGVEVARFLLRSHSDEIVDGAVVAAFATSTPRVHLHVGEGDQTGAETLARAIGRATAATGGAESGGANLPEIRVIPAPFRRNLKGYEDVPTLVVTAETLVAISRAMAIGADRFRETGTPESSGTKFFQLSGAVKRPGIYERSLGTTPRQLIDEDGGGPADGEQPRGVIVGGAKGACYLPDELDVSLDFDTVKRAGGVLGSGAVMVLSGSDCLVDLTKRSLANSCYDTCGMCSLGREGSYQLREIVGDATRGKGKTNDAGMLRELGRAMQLGCACSNGRTAPNLVLSGLARFPEEYDAHMRRKKCEALVCERYVTFHILPDLCDGCGDCAEACPEDAIEGGRRKIHVIDQDSCEKCGKCFEVCSRLQKAVVKAGTIKPRTPRRPIPVGTWNG